MHPQAISKRFVRYYQELGFKRLSDMSLLHPSVPMTFVMSAGLAQVETSLDQLEKRIPGNDYVLVQNCFRHFDVDRIGQSNFHLSLFEMPGAFSFGHNSSQVTIQHMWNFLARDLKIDSSCLWATYFTGGKVSGHFFDEDIDSYQAWRNVGLSENRIVGLGADHNFWKQGGGINSQETKRKCGPNTELFFDRGPQWSCDSNCCPGCQCGRFVEFANSLFIFAEIDADTGALSLLANPFTETVIGSERVAMILAGEQIVFDIGTIKPLINKLRSFYPRQRDESLFDIEESERVLVDHLRALVFLTADGAPPPGKGGRKRLMRILIRRVLAQMQILQIDSSSCLPALIDLLLTLTESSHPNLGRGYDTLLAYIEAEATVFNQTLSRGYRQLDRLLTKSNACTLTGRQLVNLVKQFGIPVSLLKVILTRRGFEFKENEYLKAIEQWQHGSISLSAVGR